MTADLAKVGAMKAAPFKYHAPHTVDEATEILSSDPEGAKVLAGGQSLVPMLNLRLASVDNLVDLNRISGLDHISVDSGNVVIGALARQIDVERSAQVGGALPLLTTALSHVGHSQNRSRGTVVGSLCHADPASEMPAVLLALGGQVTARSATGNRTIQAEDFFESVYTTSLEATEVATEVKFNRINGASGWSFEEVARRHGDFAIVGVVTTVACDDGSVNDARVVVFGAASTPLRIPPAEQVLVEAGTIDGGVIDRAAAAVSDGVSPANDIHGSADYRRYVAGVLARRGIGRALERARSSG
jgi:aerobic carbon-monoxide dehydrogenase medium subunit